MKYVQIQSKTTIQVTKGLQHLDLTRTDSTKDDRLNVKPNWTKTKVLIQEGQHLYPAEIANWDSVKALQKDGVLTIGNETNNEDVDAKELADKLARGEAAAKALDEKTKPTKKESNKQIGDIDLNAVLNEATKKDGE